MSRKRTALAAWLALALVGTFAAPSARAEMFLGDSLIYHLVKTHVIDLDVALNQLAGIRSDSCHLDAWDQRQYDSVGLGYCVYLDFLAATQTNLPNPGLITAQLHWPFAPAGEPASEVLMTWRPVDLIDEDITLWTVISNPFGALSMLGGQIKHVLHSYFQNEFRISLKHEVPWRYIQQDTKIAQALTGSPDPTVKTIVAHFLPVNDGTDWTMSGTLSLYEKPAQKDPTYTFKIQSNWNLFKSGALKGHIEGDGP